MNLRSVTGVYFSPAGHTKTVTRMILSKLSDKKECVDLTDPGKRPEYGFTEDEAVVVGVPVFAGRVPAKAAERLKKLHGRQTPAVLIVTYGNRAYEDALIELKDILTAQGFRPVAAAAISVQHSIVTQIAQDRPDKNDKKKMKQFCIQLKELLEQTKSCYEIGDLEVPGNHPYRPYHTSSIKIKVGSECTNCGLCIRKCPVQAISRTDPKIMDEERCTACMRCISVCPAGTRKISRLLYLALSQRLKKVCTERKEPEFFFCAAQH